MPRFFIELSYRGTAFHGWQRQKNAIGVQNVVEEALSRLFRRTILVKGASRTDAGAHARQNFAHFDLDEYPPEDVVRRLNWLLPDGVACKAIYEVPAEAHARFSVRTRVYAYCVHFQPDPFRELYSYRFPLFRVKGRVSSGDLPVDIDAMNRCAQMLTSHIDYTAFAKGLLVDQNPACRVLYARWRYFPARSQLIFIIEANRFLRGMIRGLVGTMLRVGAGFLTVDDFKDILHKKEKFKVDFSPPGSGLHLLRVKYPFRFVWRVYNLDGLKQDRGCP